MVLLNIIEVAALSMMAGIVQTVSGFGSAIVMMLGFPGVFGITRAAALAGAISMAHSGMLTCKYRKEINYRKTAIVTGIYTVVSIYIINLANALNVHTIGLVYGIFMILLAVYFILADGKINLEGPLMMVVSAVISGIGAGFFSIGGPLLAVYYNKVFEKREEYMGSIQFTFLVCLIISLATRIAKGIFTADLIKYTAVGTVFIYMGQLIGLRIAGKLKAQTLKTVIYILVLLSGVMTIVKMLA